MQDSQHNRIKKSLVAVSSVGVFFIAALWLHTWYQAQSVSNVMPDISDVQKIFSSAHHVKNPFTNNGLIHVYDAETQWMGTLLLTSPWSDRIHGYGGPTPLLIGLDRQGIIRGVVLLQNYESGSFVEKIKADGLLDRWTGIPWEHATSKQVDTIASATMTSQGIIQTVQHRLGILDQNDFVAPLQEKKIDFIAILFILLALFFTFYQFRYSSQVRIALLVISVVYLGLIQKSFLSMGLFAAWIRLGGEWPASIALFNILLLAILIPLFFGKSFYCHIVCPFGAAQELMNRIVPWHISLTRRVHTILVNTRIYFLIVIAILMLLNLSIDFSEFEPFTIFLIHAAGTWTIVLAGVSLVLSLFMNRFWCTYFCPTGALLDWFRGMKKKNQR